ncbi:MAG: O-antigen ligase family protein [Acidobacteria bacterium]|nr:O-antigen ligase family protein [Acidobacteriota bacterium]
MKVKDSYTDMQGARDAGAAATVARGAQWLALAGFAVYAATAPHSIAASWVGLSLAVLGWIARTLATGRTGLRRTAIDVPLWLFFGWTILSSLLSTEPRISLAKLVNASTFLVFYIAQGCLTRRAAVALAMLLIVSGAAGALWSACEVLYGRGVIVRELKAGSPLRGATPLREGDAVWRANGRRVSTVEEIDEEIRSAQAGTPLSLSVITRGEHVEWPGPVVTEEMKGALSSSPSGLVGGGRTHSFRASGWTRHYETFAEMLQMIAQLALGFALAALLRSQATHAQRVPRLSVAAAFVATSLLAFGIALTAMRTALVAFVAGAAVVAWRTRARGRTRLLVSAALALVCALGAFTVWRTRAGGALRLQDDSASLRLQVARTALGRVWLHPVVGHGMDAVKLHWNEWGFPGDVQIHTHSTPLQLAFERGLPALCFWLWIIYAFWLMLARAEKLWREADDAGAHGLLLGAMGALAGFFASSLVNYNFGDSEVALLLWWLAGATVCFIRDE